MARQLRKRSARQKSRLLETAVLNSSESSGNEREDQSALTASDRYALRQQRRSNGSESAKSGKSGSTFKKVNGKTAPPRAAPSRSRSLSNSSKSRGKPGPSAKSRSRTQDKQAEESSESESDVEGSQENEEESSGNGNENGEESGDSEQSEEESESSDDDEEDAEDDDFSAEDIAQRKKTYFVKGLDVQSIREEETLTRFKYLFNLGDIFRKFVDLKAKKDPKFKKLLDKAERMNRLAANRPKPAKSRNSRPSSYSGRKARRKHKQQIESGELEIEEEEEKEFEQEFEEDTITVFNESPGFLNGTLRPYQVDGLNWLISLYTNRINGIFADEMGLGKTFQCISFLGYLRHIVGISGPHLVIVPKSTVQNWAREFAQWTPEVKVCVLAGDKQERADIIKDQILQCKFDVLITSFELVIREKSTLQKIAWQYTIVDEAHRIKNEESILSKIMRILFSKHRLLITGTPLQNNLHELWALLNFLLPDVFSDSDVFDEWFSHGGGAQEIEDGQEEHSSDAQDAQSDQEESEATETKGTQDETQPEDENDESSGNAQVIQQLRTLLSPFLLRRVKSDVEHSLLPKREINLYVGMTEMQVKWYQNLLRKNVDSVNNKAESKNRLMNVAMQLRKCCNHPYLFDGAEPGPPFTTDEHIVQNSGKMIFLDKLLQRVKAQGSRVLIFSQMSRMLDILEDYCSLRDYEYCRIDGSTSHEDRTNAIDSYNRPGSNKFIFLLTTRAGGLGINLTTADQVIIYDSDWNPQADLQAMDRAHRIGQKKQVWVYRFIVENAIEEKILDRAAHKLRLDQLVIQQPSNTSSSAEKAKQSASKNELADMIRHGAQEVFDHKTGTINNELSIDEILAAGEKRTKELNAKYSELGLNELRQITFDNPPAQPVIINPDTDSDGTAANDYHDYRHHPRRARNMAVYADEVPEQAPRLNTKPPKQLVLHDYQFFPKELQELQEKELLWYRKQTGFRVSSEDYSSDEEDDSEAVNLEIEQAEPFTEEDAELKESLIKEGFPNFTKRDFFHFINLVAKHGVNGKVAENKFSDMASDWPGKKIEEIERYYKVFSERHKEISDYERYLGQLEAGESRNRREKHRMNLLTQKVNTSRTPLIDLVVAQPTGGSSTRNRFSDSNDRFLVVEMERIGLDKEDLYDTIKENIQTCGLFDFDWYFLSRSTTEISRRCGSLLNLIVKEMDQPNKDGSEKRKRGADRESKKIKQE
ncbi:hypothetical protein DASB73_016100 [Starmerella bacillaris]|uniref:Uncharacterized protein n=1 Tax=Starmerella bacillaris TaxID=1247836 RepID=A0AAV5RHT7_STABA|nr:hypothetical protein DASB73_016100 [Starmerella bacillaris]